MEQKKPLLILAGPTAVGKTALSIALAKQVEGEIISADSMQVYRGMDIGSAKIRKEEMQGVAHHLLDILNPTESFNITIFQRLAKQYMEEIVGRGHLPIIVGGTGFYIQSVLYDIDFTKEEGDGTYRLSLEELLKNRGGVFLHDMLKQVDPVSAELIHENNHKRMIRALEYYHLTGQPISEHNAKQRQKESAYNACYFVLTDRRDRLYERIDRRVDQMLSEGLVDEVKGLLAAGCKREMVSMQGLGYKEIADYLNGKQTLEEAVYFIKRNTRHFAKRQLTWFGREKEVIWINREEFGDDSGRILAYMQEKMKERML